MSNNIEDDPFMEVGEIWGDKQRSPKSTNKLTLVLWILLIFIVWWFFILFYNSEQNKSEKPTQLIYLSGTPSNIIDTASSIDEIKHTNITNKVLYVQQTSYKEGDVVMIRYFNLAGVVMSRKNNNYIVLYKNHDHSLLKVEVPVGFLMRPTDDITKSNGIND